MASQRSNEHSEQIAFSTLSDLPQINMLRAVEAVYNGMTPFRASKKFNVSNSSLLRQNDGNYGLLNIVEETLVVRCVRKLASAGLRITKRHVSDSIEILSKTLRKFESSRQRKLKYFGFFYLRQHSLLNYIEQDSNYENANDDESVKILSMLESEFRACGLYENDMRKLLKLCLQQGSQSESNEKDNQKRLGKRPPNRLQNNPKSRKKSKFDSIPINLTPLVIANVQSEYNATNESFVQNLIPDQLDCTPSTPTLRTPTIVETSVISNQATSPLPVPECIQSLNATNVLDYIENIIGSELVLRFYKNGQKKWPVDSNKGLFDLWKAIKANADQEADTESDDDVRLENDDDVKLELVDATGQF